MLAQIGTLTLTLTLVPSPMLTLQQISTAKMQNLARRLRYDTPILLPTHASLAQYPRASIDGHILTLGSTKVGLAQRLPCDTPRLLPTHASVAQPRVDGHAHAGIDGYYY